MSEPSPSAALHGSGRLLVLRLSQYLLLFLSGLIVARALGPVGRSHYALPLALSATTQFLVSLSLDYSTGRMLARREATLDEIAGLLAAAAALLAAFGTAACIALGLSLRTQMLAGASTKAVMVAAAIIPFGLVIMFSGGLLLRLGVIRAWAWVMSGSALTQLGSVAWLKVTDNLTPETALATTLLGAIVAAVGLATVLHRHVGRGAFVPRIVPRLLRPAVLDGLALHPAAFGLLLNLRVDLFLVSLLLDSRQTGLYSLSVNLAELVFLAAFTLGHLAMHVQTEADEEHAASFTVSFVKQSALLAIGFALITSVAAYPFVRVVYGEEWTGSVVPMVVLTFAAVALSVEAPLRVYLIRVLRPIQLAGPAALALCVNVSANLLLIPQVGIVGAALASLLSYACFGALTLRLLARSAGVWATLPR